MSSTQAYGVTPTGFVQKRQSDIITDMNAAIASAWGQQVNLGAQSNLGVLTGICSERLGSLWELGEAVWNSAFEGGAEGMAVDNLLQLAGTTRLVASATKTNPDSTRDANGILQNGFVVYGTPGTVVTAGKLVLTNAATPQPMSVDADILIQPAVNAVQSLILSGVPTVTGGAVTFSLVDSLGNTLSATLTTPFGASDIQAAFASLHSADSKFHYTDVEVAGSGSVFTISYGAGTPTTGNPSSGASAQSLPQVTSNTLAAVSGGSNVQINAVFVIIADGAPAQGTGSATATTTGPVAIPAGAITSISTPVSGWTGVTNQLDCIAGSNVESDTDALVRMANNRAANGNATDSAIESHVAQVSSVTAVREFRNRSGCAVQGFTFSSAPGGASYQITLAGGTTASIPIASTASAVQSAINALPGYNVVVTGDVTDGFQIDYNGSLGGQPQPLIVVTPSSGAFTASASYGRPGHSFEVVVNGGADRDIATAIMQSMPAGIPSYGAPNAVVSGVSTASNSTLAVSSTVGIYTGNMISGPGIAQGTTVVSVGSGTVQMSQAAVTSQTGNYIFSNAVAVTDSQGNSQIISFSRPITKLAYVGLSLLTDYYNIPGNISSGANPSATFSPASIQDIQSDIVNIGNAVPMGGLIVGQGTNGLVGAFNGVPGILSYGLSLALGSVPSMPSATSPTVPANIQLLPQQMALFETINIAAAWS